MFLLLEKQHEKRGKKKKKGKVNQKKKNKDVIDVRMYPEQFIILSLKNIQRYLY